jgi:hypothetical protein
LASPRKSGLLEEDMGLLEALDLSVKVEEKGLSDESEGSYGLPAYQVQAKETVQLKKDARFI